MEPSVAILLRAVALIPLCVLLYFSQRYWVTQSWKAAKRARTPAVSWLLWALACAMPVLAFPAVVRLLTFLPGPARTSSLMALSSVWLSSALLAWVLVKSVHGVERLWNRLARRQATGAGKASATDLANLPPSPSRRYFFQTAGYFAGAVPFVGALYGFAVERLKFRVQRVEVPIPGLPPELDGLRIAQLSDIHMSGYLPVDQLRRAVGMANELGAEMAVITGDLVTWRGDPIVDCIEELRALRAPLGVWGCNGNHEIYAGYQTFAADLFQQAGMRMLRQQNAELEWRGARLNLIGVDHQVTRGFDPGRWRMLEGVERLLRPGVPNILLSHSPNAFYRATELGVALTISGHTHGGQIQMEVIEPHLNPARFLTPFTAGLYALSRAAALRATRHSPPAAGAGREGELDARTSYLYVNRGLGTIATPVRIGSPPEITLLTLRRA